MTSKLANLQLWYQMPKPPSHLIKSNVKMIDPYQDQMVSNIHKFTSKNHSQTTPSLERRQPGPKIVLSALWWQENSQLWHRVPKPLSHPFKSNTKRIETYQDEMVNDIHKFTNERYSQTTHPHSGDSHGQKKFSAPFADKQSRNYDAEF